MKFNLVTIALASVAITGVAALPVMNEDTAASLEPRAEQGVEGTEGVEGAQGYWPQPDDYRPGRKGRYNPYRYQDWDYLRRIIKAITGYDGDDKTCGYGFAKHGRC